METNLNIQVSQGSVATNFRCGGKHGKGFWNMFIAESNSERI